MVVVVALGVIAVSCGEDASVSSSSGGPMTDPLTDSTFTSTSVRGRDLVADTAVRVSFEDGQLGLSAGCNSMGGAYSLDGDRLVIDGPMRSTEMACDPPLMDQDSWLSGWFADGLTWRLDADRLTLTGADVVMELTAGNVAVGTVEGIWQLETILNGETASSVPAEVKVPTLEINRGRVSVYTGCNRGDATIEVTEESIAFGPLRLTRMACSESAMQVEAAIAAALDGSAPYTVTADRLTIGDDRAGLVWRRHP